MSERDGLVAYHDRAFLDAWLIGADFPMAPTVRRLIESHDALAARLAAVETEYAPMRDALERIADLHSGDDGDPDTFDQATAALNKQDAPWRNRFEAERDEARQALRDLRPILDEICQDSLETTLDLTVACPCNDSVCDMFKRAERLLLPVAARPEADA